MIDITHKNVSFREAIAEGVIYLSGETIKRIKKGNIEKGDPIVIAKLAAIQAVKKTSDLLPLCHPIKVTGVDVEHIILDNGIKLRISVRTTEKTGVEMEALTGLLIGLATIWDVVKKYEKDKLGQYPRTSISEVKIIKKVKQDFQT
ncbi:MAG: cyclic pyranopterin monophosphate synthase MoaC [Thaumarchaeota archaeon]|nr:MAG: cyclic pyranopterin monophosphate synthase MoaC [Nitrososphaerota archaeon]